MDICVICLDNIACNFSITKCNHKFHTNCLQEWYKYKNNCPICRCYVNLPCKYWSFENWSFENFKNELFEIISDVLHVFVIGTSIGYIDPYN
tara:strand:+ start:772 stop:1047 length:276 start_codon:yes stop_codon:yes gene_type:complete